VRMQIDSGRIVAVDGGADAMLVRDYLEQSGDDDAYGISHSGWGMNPHARWDAFGTAHWDEAAGGTRGIGMESRSFCGSVMVSAGTNVGRRGTKRSACQH